MLRRLATVVAMSLSVAVAWAAPAGADGDLGVGNPGQHSDDALVARGQGLNVTTFSGSGPALGPNLQVDLSALDARIAVTANGEACTRSGSVITCGRLYSVKIDPGSTAGPGPSGRITIRNTTGMASINVDVLTAAQSTLAGSDVTASGKIGDVVALPLSIRNKGPNSFYKAGFSGLALADNTRLVSVDGCSRPKDFDCTRDYFQVGTSLRVTLHLRIVSCGSAGDSGGYGLMSNPGAKFVFGRFTVKVAGCSTNTQTDGGSSETTHSTPTSPAATPTATTSPEPSASASASPSEAVSSAPSLVAATADQTQPQSPLPLVGAGVALLGALGVLGLRVYRRKRKQSDPAT